MFEIFLEYNILIKPIKSYFDYPDISLLGHQVNSSGLTTSAKKLKAIWFLTYFNTLGALEYYLGLTGYFYNYIYFYAQLAAPFQALKTSLLRDALVNDHQRWAYISKTKLRVPTPQKLVSFQSVQDTLSHPSTLVYHNPDKML